MMPGMLAAIALDAIALDAIALDAITLDADLPTCQQKPYQGTHFASSPSFVSATRVAQTLASPPDCFFGHLF